MAHPKILISACLLGHPVRYDGTSRQRAHPALRRWRDEGRLISICPEVAAGFSVPRPPAEIQQGGTGDSVLSGVARVVDAGGSDVTDLYVLGAQAALALALEHKCPFALLVDGSPSCGSGFIYDGSFGSRRHVGAGVTADLLRRHGIEVFAETEIDTLAACLSQTQYS